MSSLAVIAKHAGPFRCNFTMAIKKGVNMKTILKAALFVTLLASCSESRFDNNQENTSKPLPVTSSDDQPCTVMVLGDNDGFGMGLAEGGGLSLKAGTSLPIDHRTAGDPNFTDIYSAEMGGSSNMPYQILFTMEFAKPTTAISSAKFRLNTLGIQDGDNQVCGVDTDIRVYIDGQEIPNALDQVDQFDMVNGSWADIASHIELEIPANLLYVLNDGKVQVRWDMLQLNPNSQSHEGFAIDYCELQLCYSKAR
jgi:hypothetical protein